MKKKPVFSLGAAATHFSPRALMSSVLIVAAYVFAFIILDFAALKFPEYYGIVLWYPSAGLTYALLLVFGAGFTPAVTIALLISSIFINRLPQSPWLLFLWAFIFSAIYGAAAVFLRKRRHFDWQLRKLPDAAWFVFTAVLVSAFLAALSVLSSALSSAMPRSEIIHAIYHRWIAETVGVLTVAPFLLVFVMPFLKRLPACWPYPRPKLTIAGQALALAFALYWVFGGHVLFEFRPLVFITLPLIWIAMDHGFRGAALGIAAAHFGVMIALWFSRNLSQLDELQLLMMVNSVVGLLMGAAVTERKRVEMELRENETFLNSVIENIPNLISVKDARDLRYVRFNKAGEELLGFSNQDMVGKNDFDFFPPDKAESFIKKDRETLANKKLVDIPEEKILTRKKGERIFHTKKIPILDEAGNPKYLLGISEDITELKRAEETLRESEKRYRGLFEDSPVSLWEEDFSAVKKRLEALRAGGVTDLRAYLQSHPDEVENFAALINVLDVNKASIKMYRAKNKAHLINNLAQIVSVNHNEKFIDELVNIWEGLTRFNYEAVNQAMDGERIDINFFWAVAPGYENDLSRVLASIVDITERKQAEAEMGRLVEELRNLSETEKKNRIFAEALAKNVISINSSLKTDEILDSIIDNIKNVVPSDGANIMLIQGDRLRMVRAKGYRERGLGEWEEQKEFDLNEIKNSEEIIRSKKFVITGNTEKSNHWSATKENAWIKSNIIAPVLDGSRVIGFVNVDSATPDHYSEEHAQQLIAFTEQVSTALKNARLFEETQRRMNRMQAMAHIALAINASLDINVAMEIVLIQAKDHLNADAVDILLVNKAAGTLVFSKAKGFKTDEVRKSNFRLGNGLPGKTVLERILVAIPDLTQASESYFKNLLIEKEGFVSYYCAPLITKGELKGVMEIYFRQPFKTDPEWREFLEMLAQQTAIAINNAELLNSLKVSNADLMNAYETTLKGWVDALDMRDHETEGHTRRVTEMSLQLALRMGIKESEIINFERGSLLHDIGKVAISDSILNKPGPLTEEEWVIMRQHPLNAFQLLSKSKYLIPALDIPYCHHEKWDGSGYPRGLKGEAIPLAARIFAVVDVWDALISDRPYRKAWTQKKALDYIQEQSGKHFDPQVVSAFLSLLKASVK